VDQLNARLAKPIEPFKLARRIDTINRLTHDPEVAQAILDYAAEEGVPEQVAFETARRYAREIVPSFSAMLYFQIATRLAQWLSSGLYEVRVTGEAEAMDGLDPDATVVFVLNHRSNMDYVLVTWLAAKRTALAYAVGEWARRWPLRPLIRAMGGYFVRRKNLNPLYRRVLARYVQISTEKGVTQAFFPEGRLARTGALQDPKLGILSYIVGDGQPPARDVVFVPVALNYERVLEDRLLIAATSGGPQAFRLRWWTVARYLWRHVQLRLTRRFTRFGYAAVAFGPPLSLRAFLARPHADPTAALADALMTRIAAQLPVLPLPLVAEALLDGIGEVDAIVARIDRRIANLAGQGHPIHYTASDTREAAFVALRMLEVRNAVSIGGPDVTIREGWHDILRYYANTLPVRKVGRKKVTAGAF
jgi:glycerol-3-phosphate O-acyltransferase